MRLTNSKDILGFRLAISKCKGDVWMESPAGDKFNMKSVVSQYIALGALLKEEGETLELFCSDPQDEAHFYQFFNTHPNTLSNK